jgi:2-oxoisovalerate dehydrogenase E1 component
MSKQPKNKSYTKNDVENKNFIDSNDNNGYKIPLSKEKLIEVLKMMITTRVYDNKAMNYLRQGKTFFHIAASGHEAVQIAAGLLLNPKKDWLFPYYRDVGIVFTAGVTPKETFLQSFAKAADPSSGGRQMPMHWGHPNINLPSQSSPTGTQFLQAVGVALANKKLSIDSITYVSSGEGTTSQGEFHEAVNWASRDKLPVLFMIENNKFAISVHVSSQTAGEGHSIAAMMKGYNNLLTMKIDGTDFFECYNSISKAIEYIKSGKGPCLIESDVVRLQSHSSSDDQKKYRLEKEIQEDLKRDPIIKFSKYLIENNLINQKEIDQLWAKIDDEITQAADEAMTSVDPKKEDALKFVYDESNLKNQLVYESSQPNGKPIVMVDSINHALHEELKLNDKIYVFGEDIADAKGGVFTATKGLSTKFGNQRVFNSPLAEASIIGVAIGMSLVGLKPVVEIQFGDYIWPAFNQIKDELATFRYRSNNSYCTPVVIRVAVGGYIHGGLFHSQNIESIFAHIPGIYIAYPSNAADAKGLLKTACRLNDPVLFCEHKGLYRQSFAMTPEPDESFLIPFGKAKVAREGTDVTVISWGVSFWDSILAAKKLQEEFQYSVEVIDIRTINPLDEETIFNSVKKTNKAIVIHEDNLTGGFGAEIAARISESCFKYLDAPVRRIAALDAHIPYSPILEYTVLPSRDKIYNGILELIKY